MGTKNCVRCFKLAKFWTGHVFKGKKTITAGWCTMRCLNAPGFVGHYSKKMGIYKNGRRKKK